MSGTLWTMITPLWSKLSPHLFLHERGGGVVAAAFAVNQAAIIKHEIDDNNKSSKPLFSLCFSFQPSARIRNMTISEKKQWRRKNIAPAMLLFCLIFRPH